MKHTITFQVESRQQFTNELLFEIANLSKEEADRVTQTCVRSGDKVVMTRVDHTNGHRKIVFSNREETEMKRNRDLSTIRLQKVIAAIQDEKARFNAAIHAGAVVKLTTFNGPYTVKYVDDDFWYHTDGNGGLGQSWCGCNDGRWADLLQQAGVSRHPLFQN